MSFDEIKKTVTLQMAIERYGIQRRRMNVNKPRRRGTNVFERLFMFEPDSGRAIEAFQ